MDKSIIAIEDIDADGRDEMLWRISGEFAGLPRGYAVHDPLTGKKKWEFLCGSTPFRTSVKDIDGDGKKEIFFSVKAPHNNVSYNNMSDDTSYIGELDCYGNLKWCLPAGGFFSQLFMKVEDLERDGKFEMITARSCHREENPDPGQIRVYDAMTGKILYTFNHIGVSFTNLHVVNMNDDSNLEIVTEDSEGGIRIWDYKLGLCEEYKGNKDLKILGVEKVQGYDYPLIFTWYSFNTLRIFDHRLRVVFDHRFPKDLPKVRDPIVPVSDGENTSYLFSTDRTYTISPGKTNRFQDYLSLFGSRFSYYLLGVLVFNGLLYAGWLQRKRLKAHSLELLREGAKSSPEWMTVAQEALHKMKSPLTAILWETEKIDGLMEKKRLSKTFFSKLREINEAILADVNELKLMNRFLMKIMQAQNLRMQQIDINNVILSLVEDYRKRYGGKFTFSSGEFQKLPPVEADEEQLTEAFAIIIDNAVDAVPEGGTVSISAVYRKNMPGGKQQNVVEVAVEDNGCGIPDDKQDRIFEPYFTTKKEGTGIGLAIAKRIVESHDGWIEMESRENVGTKFALYFPLKRLDRDKH